MENIITYSMLDYPFTYDGDGMDKGVSKSTVLEPTIEQLMKETSLCRRAARNLVSRGENIGA